MWFEFGVGVEKTGSPFQIDRRQQFKIVNFEYPIFRPGFRAGDHVNQPLHGRHFPIAPVSNGFLFLQLPQCVSCE